MILLVEDNKGDVFLIRESIEAARVDASLRVVSDGDRALKFIEDAEADPAAPCPDIVLLDINLPKKSGHEVLRRMREGRRCARIPVLVVTSSDSQKDREEMARLGVSGYFRKPSEYEEFMKLGPIVKNLLQP